MLDTTFINQNFCSIGVERKNNESAKTSFSYFKGLFFGSPRLGVCVPSVCTGKMVETTLNKMLKNVSSALNLTSDTLGGIGFAYSVGNNEYLADDNTEYTGGDIAAV